MNKSKRWLGVPVGCALATMAIASMALPASTLAAPGKPAKKPRDFDGITCQTDITQAMIGRRLTEEDMTKTQQRYKELGLDIVGGEVREDGLELDVWTVCGRVYDILMSGDDVVGVLPPLPLSDKRDYQTGYEAGIECVIDGVKTDEDLLAAPDPKLSAQNGQAESDEPVRRAVTQAWLIDSKAQKFKKIEAKSIVCDFQ